MVTVSIPRRCRRLRNRSLDTSPYKIRLQDKIVRSALTGAPQPALEALIEDPTSPRDESACVAMFNELRKLQAEQLPF